MIGQRTRIVEFVDADMVARRITTAAVLPGIDLDTESGVDAVHPQPFATAGAVTDGPQPAGIILEDDGKTVGAVGVPVAGIDQEPDIEIAGQVDGGIAPDRTDLVLLLGGDLDIAVCVRAGRASQGDPGAVGDAQAGTQNPEGQGRGGQYSANIRNGKFTPDCGHG